MVQLRSGNDEYTVNPDFYLYDLVSDQVCGYISSFTKGTAQKSSPNLGFFFASAKKSHIAATTSLGNWKNILHSFVGGRTHYHFIFTLVMSSLSNLNLGTKIC